MARSLWKSAALRAGLALGLSGVVLAAGNLILARILPTTGFAQFALFFAIVQIGISVGPLGADVIMTRRHLHPGRALQRRVFLQSSVVAVLLSAAAFVGWHLDAGLILCMLVSIVAGSIKVVPTSYYRSHQRFGAALLLTVSTNVAIFVSVAAAFVLHAMSALAPAAGMMLALCISAWVGWRSIAATARRAEDHEQSYPMSEAWSTVSFIAAGMILGSLERLIAPGLIGMSAVAILSVLATIAGSPFQVLHNGIGYTLLPALRNALGRPGRLRVLRHEAMVVGAACAAATLGVLWLTPVISKTILSGRYPISTSLLVTAIGLGIVKVFGSLAASTVNAFGSGRDLAKLSLIGWLAIAVGLTGGWIGSRFGVIGLMIGVTCGWLLRALLVGLLALRQLSSEPVTGLAAHNAWENS
jgi:O-antigen/teichoic acid export membrane protein